MGGVIRDAMGSRIQLLAQAPPPVEIELHEQPDRLLVHLVNNTGDNEYPLQKILPVGPIHLSVSSRPVKQARTTSGEAIRFSYVEGRSELDLQLNEQYVILSLEYA